MANQIAYQLLKDMWYNHPEWMQDGACVDSEIDHLDPDQERAAKRECNRCPSKSECLAYAKSKGITNGVWGGKTFTSS